VSSGFLGRSARGTIAAPTASQTDDVLVAYQAFGYGATAYSSTAAGSILIRAGGNWTDASYPTYIGFYTAPSGSTTVAERLRVAADGTLQHFGTSSGTVTLAAQAAAGTPTLTWPTGSGTFAVSATSPLTLSATTGALTCSTCGVTGTGLNQFASTTSAQLAGVISDETGSGSAVFGTAPTLTNATLATRLNKGIYIVGMSAVTGMSVTGTLTETTLATISVPANAMGANGALRITAQWSKTGTAGTLQAKMKFAGTTFHDSGVTGGATVISGRTQVEIHNRNATNSQVAASTTQVNFSAQNTAAVVTSAIDTTSNQDVTLTCQLGNTGDTCVLESYTVELLEP